MRSKDTCNWTKHNFSCFCSQCDPWKARFTCSHILISKNSPGSEKKKWFNFSSNLCPIFGIHSKMWKSNVMVGQQLAAIWQTNFAKEEAAKAKIFNIFHKIRSYLFSRLLLASISKINFTKKENENFNIFHRMVSCLEKTHVINGIVFASPLKFFFYDECRR